MLKEQLLEEFEKMKEADPEWEYQIDGKLFSFKYGKNIPWRKANVVSIDMTNGEIYSKGSSELSQRIIKEIQSKIK